MATDLWVEKYRPATLDGYVLKDESLKNKINQWVQEKTIPHLLFHGGPGTGKTTLAKVLFNMLGVDKSNIKIINASLKNGVEYIRTTVEGFASNMPFMSQFSYILLDEADHLSPEAQATLRNLMETYAHQCRFVMTCNYPNRIIPALKSRLQEYEISKPDKPQFEERAVRVLLEEQVEIDPDALGEVIDSTYPDLRKCLNLLQQNTVNGKLESPSSKGGDTEDWRVHAVAYFREKQYVEGRKLMCAKAQPNEYDEIWTFLYNNINFWSNGDPNIERNCVVALRNGMAKAPLCADPELNLAATLVELELAVEGA